MIYHRQARWVHKNAVKQNPVCENKSEKNIKSENVFFVNKILSDRRIRDEPNKEKISYFLEKVRNINL